MPQPPEKRTGSPGIKINTGVIREPRSAPKPFPHTQPAAYHRLTPFNCPVARGMFIRTPKSGIPPKTFVAVQTEHRIANLTKNRPHSKDVPQRRTTYKATALPLPQVKHLPKNKRPLP